MCVQRWDVLVSLISMISKQSKMKLDGKHLNSLNKIEDILNKEILLFCPAFNEVFEIHTYTSHLQLGTVISQRGKLRVKKT